MAAMNNLSCSSYALDGRTPYSPFSPSYSSNNRGSVQDAGFSLGHQKDSLVSAIERLLVKEPMPEVAQPDEPAYVKVTASWAPGPFRQGAPGLGPPGLSHPRSDGVTADIANKQDAVSESTTVPDNLSSPSTPRSCEAARPTTILVRHLPNRFSQQSLMQQLEKLGLQGTYDFLYSPDIVKGRPNVRYAYINFKDSEFVPRAVALLQGRLFAPGAGTTAGPKPLAVAIPESQGLISCLQRFEKTNVDDISGRKSRTAPFVAPDCFSF